MDVKKSCSCLAWTTCSMSPLTYEEGGFPVTGSSLSDVDNYENCQAEQNLLFYYRVYLFYGTSVQKEWTMQQFFGGLICTTMSPEKDLCDSNTCSLVSRGSLVADPNSHLGTQDTSCRMDSAKSVAKWICTNHTHKCVWTMLAEKHPISWHRCTTPGVMSITFLTTSADCRDSNAISK